MFLSLPHPFDYALGKPSPLQTGTDTFAGSRLSPGWLRAKRKTVLVGYTTLHPPYCASALRWQTGEGEGGEKNSKH